MQTKRLEPLSYSGDELTSSLSNVDGQTYVHMIYEMWLEFYNPDIMQRTEISDGGKNEAIINEQTNLKALAII